MIRQTAVLAVAAICLYGLSTAKCVNSSSSEEEFETLQGCYNSLMLSLEPYGEIDQTLLEYSKKFDYEKFLEFYTKKEVLMDFWRIYQRGMLPRDHIFSSFDHDHLEQSIALFKLFYYAPSFDSCMQLAAWARVNVNKEMFVYAYSIAILHRTDTKELSLPDLTQIFPNYFYNSDFMTAYANRAIAIYKGHGDADYLREPIWANYTYTYMKNTRDPETSLTYFFEDVDVNMCYYYMHLMTPFWMSNKEFPITKHRGILYQYIHKWIINRLRMERRSIGLGPIEHIDWNKPIQTGYTPMMMYSNGQLFPQRKEFSYVPESLYGDVEDMIDLEKRVKESMDFGYIVDKHGKFVPIAGTYQGFDEMVKIIEGNADSSNFDYYGSLDRLGRRILGFISKREDMNQVLPSALEGFSTSLRDPAFYRHYDKIIKYLEKMLKHVKIRKAEEVTNTHFSIKSFKVDDLITYFETHDRLVSNLSIPDGSSFAIKARQKRLTHKPFVYHFNVKSDKIAKARVRIFLGPPFRMADNPTYEDFKEFYLVDYFVHDMVVGENIFTRSSEDSPLGVSDFREYPWFDTVDKKSPLGFMWPQRMLFPKGTCDGMPAHLYVYIMESNPTEVDTNPNVDTAWKKFEIDTKPYEYPMDRAMETHDLPNAKLLSLRIYHKDESEVKLTD